MHAEVSNGLPVPIRHLHTTNIQHAGDYVKSSKRYHLISQVAHKQVQSYSYLYVSGADSSYEIEKTVPSFICSKKVFWNMACAMTDNDVLKELSKRSTNGSLLVRNRVKEHCEENSHSDFYFAVREVFDNGRQTTNLYMQRELFKAVKIFGGFIPLYFFKESIDGNNPLLLTQNLAYIFGAAVAGCYSPTSMTQQIKKGDNVDVFSFKKYCAGKLREIMLTFPSFDFMS